MLEGFRCGSGGVLVVLVTLVGVGMGAELDKVRGRLRSGRRHLQGRWAVWLYRLGSRIGGMRARLNHKRCHILVGRYRLRGRGRWLGGERRTRGRVRVGLRRACILMRRLLRDRSRSPVLQPRHIPHQPRIGMSSRGRKVAGAKIGAILRRRMWWMRGVGIILLGRVLSTIASTLELSEGV